MVASFRAAAAQHGYPASVLTDNGLVYTTRLAGGRGGRNDLETLLVELGIEQKHSRPNHPTTCGKVERFQQTTQRWLAARDPAEAIADLQAQLDTWRTIYNDQRPHSSLRRRPPAVVYHLLPKATPRGSTAGAHHRYGRAAQPRLGPAPVVAQDDVARVAGELVVGEAHPSR